MSALIPTGSFGIFFEIVYLTFKCVLRVFVSKWMLLLSFDFYLREFLVVGGCFRGDFFRVAQDNDKGNSKHLLFNMKENPNFFAWFFGAVRPMGCFAALQYNPQRALAQRQHSTTFVAGDKISITLYLCCGVAAAVVPMPGYLQWIFPFRSSFTELMFPIGKLF